MWSPRDLDWRRGLIWLAAFALLAMAGLGLFAASGVYNVAASGAHFAVTDRLIKFVLHRSVATYSAGVEVPDLSGEGLARLGAVHFLTGCAPCHGGEAQARNPIARGMLPAPPPLHDAARDWETAELFRIVRHGLKFTGMPAWPGSGRDDEVWAVVAYLERLAQAGDAPAARATASDASRPLRFGATADAGLALCADCHGDASRPPVAGLVPALQGQKPAYLRRAMREYREGLRESGMMEPIAAALGQARDGDVLARYAAMAKPPPQAVPDPAAVARGEEIARRGDAAGGIPPCLSCHSQTASPLFPDLAGLSQDYIAGQLRLFRQGLRDRTAYGAVMTAVARRLAPAQVEAVAAFFAQAGAGGDAGGREAEARKP